MDNQNEVSVSEHAPTAPVVSDTAKQVLEQMAKDGATIEGAPSNVAIPEKAPKVEAKVEAKAEAEAPEKPTEAPKEPKVERQPSLMPTWQHKVAEKKMEKEISELKEQIAKLSQAKGDTAVQTEAAIDEVDALAEKYNLDDSGKGLVRELQESILKKLGPSKDLQEKVQALDNEKKAIEQQKFFDQEFNNDVLPALKAEYPDISEAALAEVKDKLLERAFTEVYAKIPLKKVYLAEKDDLKVSEAPKRKSGETGKSGKERGSDTVDFDHLSEDDFSKLSPDQMLKFSQHQAKKGGGWNR